MRLRPRLVVAELVPVSYQGELVAAVSLERLHILAPWLLDRPGGDPELRFVAMMCACARQVLTGKLPGPYTEALGEEWARAALVDEQSLLSVAALTHDDAAAALGVPHEQMRAIRAESQRSS